MFAPMGPTPGRRRTRLVAASAAGVSLSVASAVVLGDYPLTGAVPWVAPVVIPLLIGVTMSAAAGSHRPLLWSTTGPLSAAAILWGVRIATGWGLDPMPGAWWAVTAVALVWPPGWALVSLRNHSRAGAAPYG